VAHDAVPVAPRLPLHPAGRVVGNRTRDLPEHRDHHGAGRPVARRGMDLRAVGRAARSRPGRRVRAA
jgi:hypothetical protein